jgi:hypothetical protein
LENGPEIFRGHCFALPVPEGSGMAIRTLVEFVDSNFAAKRISVNPQKARGARLVATGPVQNPLYKLLLEFIDSFIEMNSSLHHLSDQSFQLILHCRTLPNGLIRWPAIPPARSK